MPRRRKAAREYRGEPSLTVAEIETLAYGQPLLSVHPPQTFRGLCAWRDTPEAAAAWRRHRKAILREWLAGPRAKLPWGARFDPPAERRELEKHVRPKPAEPERKKPALEVDYAPEA